MQTCNSPVYIHQQTNKKKLSVAWYYQGRIEPPKAVSLGSIHPWYYVLNCEAISHTCTVKLISIF